MEIAKPRRSQARDVGGLLAVDDEAEADEVLELRMLLRKPALQPQSEISRA